MNWERVYNTERIYMCIEIKKYKLEWLVESENKTGTKFLKEQRGIEEIIQ